MEYKVEIAELKAKRAELEAQLCTTGIDKEEKHDIRQQIIAVDNQITAYINHIQPKTCGGLLLRDRVQGVAINLRFFRDDPTTGTHAMFPLVDVIVDTGANFTLILASGAFDGMIEALGLKSVTCNEKVTSQEGLDRCVRAVFVQLPDLRGEDGAPLCESMKIYRGDVSLFGLQALELFHIGVSPSKEIFRWTSTFCGYAVQRGDAVVRQPNSPIL